MTGNQRMNNQHRTSLQDEAGADGREQNLLLRYGLPVAVPAISEAILQVIHRFDRCAIHRLQPFVFHERSVHCVAISSNKFRVSLNSHLSKRQEHKLVTEEPRNAPTPARMREVVTGRSGNRLFYIRDHDSTIALIINKRHLTSVAMERIKEALAVILDEGALIPQIDASSPRHLEHSGSFAHRTMKGPAHAASTTCNVRQLGAE
jgi:hypothetical protein